MRQLSRLPVLDVQFRRTGRFPGVLFLDPEPADRLCTSRPLSLSGGLRRLPTALPGQIDVAGMACHLDGVHIGAGCRSRACH